MKTAEVVNGVEYVRIPTEVCKRAWRNPSSEYHLRQAAYGKSVCQFCPYSYAFSGEALCESQCGNSSKELLVDREAAYILLLEG